MASLGGRAKNSPIREHKTTLYKIIHQFTPINFSSRFCPLGKLYSVSIDTYADHIVSIVKPLIKYCHRDDPQVHEWSADHEERWGIRIEDCVSMERGQPTPASSMKIQDPPHPRRPEQQGDDPSRPLHEIPSSRGQHIDPRGSASARSVSDTDFDPALQGGLGNRNQIGVDVLPSLPSLKSSGLLDSWNAPTDLSSTSGQMSWNTLSHARSNSPSVVESQEDLEVPSTPLPSGMPVGMAWLANEPTATR
jgi:hypothetical protein